VEPVKGGIIVLAIDLNADVGESKSHEQWVRELRTISLVSSVNVACAWHAGSADLMMQTVRYALKNGVAIGAHPGLPDISGFGRRALALSAPEIYAAVLYQVAALAEMVRIAGGTLQHVKLHGALYHMAGEDETIAVAVSQAVADLDGRILLYAAPNSELCVAGQKKGLRVIREAFADRTYEPNSRLSERGLPGAVISEQATAVNQALSIVREKKVCTRTGAVIPLQAETLCVHGDNEHAIALLSAIRQAITEGGVAIAAP
jgi:UPF0271 protein